MNYTMLEMPFGNKPKSILEFKIDYKITDFCHTQSGFLFLLKDQHCIGRINFDRKIELPLIGEINEKGMKDGYKSLLNYPSSICYSKEMNEAYVVENSGITLRKIQLHSIYTKLLLTEVAVDSIKKYFNNGRESTDTYCDVDRMGQIYWGVQFLHRLFIKERMDVKMIAGNGKSGFSLSNKIKECSFSGPSGIKCINDAIYVLEQGNHCIRQIQDDKITVVAGIPMIRGDEDGNGLNCKFSCLRSLTGLKNMLYFIDNNKVKYFALSQRDVGTVYASNNLVSLDSDKDKKIYILERNEA